MKNEMKKLKLGKKVAILKGDGYFIGVIRKMQGHKALVYFKNRSISRWCNVTNLEELA